MELIFCLNVMRPKIETVFFSLFRVKHFGFALWVMLQDSAGICNDVLVTRRFNINLITLISIKSSVFSREILLNLLSEQHSQLDDQSPCLQTQYSLDPTYI